MRNLKDERHCIMQTGTGFPENRLSLQFNTNPLQTFNNRLRAAALGLLVLLMAAPPMAAQEKKKDPAAAQYFRANTLYQRKLYEIAAKEYNAFLKANPNHEKAPNARFGLSLSYLGMKKFDLAEPLLAKLAMNPKAPNREFVHLFWGQALLQLRKNTEAEKAYTAGLKLPGQEGNVQMKTGLLEAQFAQKKWEEVIASADVLGKLKGKGAPRANFQGAIARYELNQFAEAAKAFEELKPGLKGSPFEQQAHYLLAESHRELKDYAKAVAAYDMVARQLKGRFSAEALFRMGIVRFDHLKEFDKAAADFGEFRVNFKDDPRTIEAGVYLGRSHLENTKLPEAQRFQVAENVFEGLATSPKATVDVPLWQARTFYRQRNEAKHNAAIAVLTPAIGKYANDAKLPDLLFELGKNQYVLEKYADTSRTMGRLIKGHAGFRFLDDAMRLNADALHFDKQYAESRAVCDMYLAKYGKEPEAGNVAWLLGENHFLVEDYDKAIAAFEDFVGKHKGHLLESSANFRIGNSYYNMKKWDEAMKVLEPLTADAKVSAKFIQIHFLVGQCYFHMKAWAKAVSHFDEFVSGNPKAPDADTALLFSGLASRQAKAGAAAIATFDKVRKDYAESQHMARVLVELGTLQFETKAMAKARTALEEVATKHAKSKWRPNAEYILGFVARGEDKPDEAIQHFAFVAGVKEHDLAADARFQQGMILMGKKDHKGAEGAFKQLLGDHADFNKKDEATFSLGQSLEQQERWDEALAEYGKVGGFQESGWRDNALYQSAWCEIGAKREPKAVEFYGRLLAEFPEGELFNLAGWELAELEFKSGKYAEAAKRLEGVLQKSKDAKEAVLRSRARYRLAWSYFEQGGHAKAAEIFEGFAKTLPSDAPKDLTELAGTAAYQAGESRMQMAEAAAGDAAKEEQYKVALMNYQSALGAKSGGPVVQSQSQLQLGKVQGLLKDWAAAEKTYDAFVAMYPEHKLIRDAWYGQGWAREGRGEFARAIESFKNVVKDSRKDELGARTVYHLGDCHYQIAKSSKAPAEVQSHCTEAIIMFADLSANYPEELGEPKGVWQARALLGTGLALELAGKKDDARKQYEELVQKFPKSNAAAIARQKLN